MATNCSLYRDKIPEAIETFITEHDGVTYEHTVNRDDQDVYRLSIGNAKCFLTIYYKNNGLTSISFQASKKYKELGQECVDHIIAKTSLPDTLHKTFTIENSNVEQYEYFKEAIKENVSVEPITTKDSNVSDRFKATDSTGAEITVTLYKNDTFYIQGRITPLYITVMCFALDWLVTNDKQTVSSCLGMQNMTVAFNEDPCVHIHNNEVLLPDGEVLLKCIQTTLQLANSGLIVSDYSCYTFGMLRAMEGIIKMRLLLDVPPFEDFGEYFYKKRATNSYHFHESCTLYDGNLSLKRALEHAYTFFNNNRHSTFHVDDQIDTTRILSYTEAITLVQEGLSLINDVCNNW